MEELISLVGIVSKQKIKKISLVSEAVETKSKIQQLYLGIAEGEITGDGQALKVLYNNNSSIATLNKLKSRLKKRLLNSIFFIDINKPSFTDYKRAKFELHRHWTIIRLLIDRGDRLVSISLLKSTLTTSLKFDFTDISVLCARELSRHYSIIDPSQKKAKLYATVLSKKSELLNNELKLEKYYNELSLLSIIDKSPDKSKLIESIDKIENELEEIFLNHKSLLVVLYYFNILSEKYLIRKEFEKCIDHCIISLKYFKNRKIKNKKIEGQINNALILSYLSLHKFQKAKVLMKKNLGIFTVGSYSWFKILSHQCMASFLTKDYQASMKTIQMALKHKHIINYGHYYELFQLQAAYLNLLVMTDVIYFDPRLKHKKFKLAKFLNSVPRFSKSKRGLNVAILIVSFLHLILNNQFEKLLSRIDALKQYSYRYLRNDHTFRSNCFIKILCKIPDVNYHPVALERHTKKLYGKLSTTSYSYSDNPAELEVIPYETLWEIVLKILDKNQKKRLA